MADQEQVQGAVRDAVGEVLDGRVRPEIPGPAHNVPADADGWGLVLRVRKETLGASTSLHFQIVPKIGNYIPFVETNSVVISLLSSYKVLWTGL